MAEIEMGSRGLSAVMRVGMAEVARKEVFDGEQEDRLSIDDLDLSGVRPFNEGTRSTGLGCSSTNGAKAVQQQ
jgi:hypothetical protein